MLTATLCFLVQGDPIRLVLLGYKKAGFGMGKYGGFGGKVEPGEAIPAAARREVAEECGLEVEAGDLLPAGRLEFVFPYKPAWSQVVHVFRAYRWHGRLVESAEMAPAWFKVENIPYGQMWADAHYYLPEVLAGRQLEGRFIFAHDLEQIAAISLKTH